MSDVMVTAWGSTYCQWRAWKPKVAYPGVGRWCGAGASSGRMVRAIEVDYVAGIKVRCDCLYCLFEALSERWGRRGR